MAELKCKAHPRYKAMRAPISGCADCEAIWRLKKRLEEPARKAEPQDNTIGYGFFDPEQLEGLIAQRDR